MKSFFYHIRFLFPVKLKASVSARGNPACVKNRMFLSILFFSLIFSALYGQGGVVHIRGFVHDGVLRQYLLYVPAAYNIIERDWPLVINYHGFTSSAGLQMDVHSKMNFVADTAHFLVAYPQGLVVQDLVSGVSGTGWNIPGLYNASHDDVAFTDSLIDHIDADFRVDLERLHTTGWSNGSEMVFYLACKLPDRIASVAGVSGLMSNDLLDSCDVERPFSTLLMHGTADPIYPFTGFPNFTPSAPTIPLFWASHNNCMDSIITELPDIDPTDNCTVTLIEYVNCDSAEVLFYRINNGGHAWPGGPYIPGILGNTNYDINASSEIWNFFKRNPMPDTTITSIADNVDHILKNFHLYQNYPNPFNPSTTIKYSVLKPSHVELKIYNALGQLVKTLVDGYQTTGEYAAMWDGKDNDGNLLTSGIYFYRIQMGEFSAVRKMTYLK